MSCIGIAVSSSDEPLKRFDAQTAANLLEKLADSLKKAVRDLEEGKRETGLGNCRNLLQLLLCLLRLRKSEDKEVKMLLHPSSTLTGKFRTILNDLVKIDCSNELIVKIHNKAESLPQESYRYLEGINPDELIEFPENEQAEAQS